MTKSILLIVAGFAIGTATVAIPALDLVPRLGPGPAVAPAAADTTLRVDDLRTSGAPESRCR